MVEVIIFSDAGVDDLAAIYFLQKSKDVSIRALVACAGNGSSNRAYDVLHYFFGQDLNIYCAPNAPIEKHFIHAAIESLPIAHIPHQRQFSECSDALFSSSKVMLVSLAPLTTISDLVSKYATHIDSLVIMGGTYVMTGNETLSSEFNFHHDSVSANGVLHTPILKTLVPLDVTTKLRFSQQHIDAVTHPELKFLFQKVLAHYITLGDNSIPLHDLTTVMFVTHSNSFTIKPRYCSVAIGDLKGKLVVDEHRYERQSHNTLLVVDVDISPLHFAFMEVFNG